MGQEHSYFLLRHSGLAEASRDASAQPFGGTARIDGALARDVGFEVAMLGCGCRGHSDFPDRILIKASVAFNRAVANAPALGNWDSM